MEPRELVIHNDEALIGPRELVYYGVDDLLRNVLHLSWRKLVLVHVLDSDVTGPGDPPIYVDLSLKCSLRILYIP